MTDRTRTVQGVPVPGFIYEGQLITILEGSRLFWFVDRDEVRLDISRGGRAETVLVRPARLCVPAA